MTAIEISRIANAKAKATGGGFIARCPAHDDRSPSLSIREGQDGRVLLKCFAGCEPDAIAGALGLTLRDLFASDAPVRDRRSPRATADDIEQSLQAELTRVLVEESERTGFDVTELTRHRNAARAVVERRYGVQLKREAALWFEVDPHAVDPFWGLCVDQAISVAAARREVAIETLRASISDLPRTQQQVIAYARKLQRSLALPATRARS